MDKSVAVIRPIPLKFAGIIGIFSGALYLAVIIGQEPGARLAIAYFFLALTFIAGGAAWFADRAAGRERLTAKVATAIFFVLGLLSGTTFTVVYLVAVALCVIGFVGVEVEESDA